MLKVIGKFLHKKIVLLTEDCLQESSCANLPFHRYFKRIINDYFKMYGSTGSEIKMYINFVITMRFESQPCKLLFSYRITPNFG